LLQFPLFWYVAHLKGRRGQYSRFHFNIIYRLVQWCFWSFKTCPIPTTSASKPYLQRIHRRSNINFKKILTMVSGRKSYAWNVYSDFRSFSRGSNFRAKIVIVLSVPEMARYFYRQWFFRNVSVSISHDFLWFFPSSSNYLYLIPRVKLYNYFIQIYKIHGRN